MDAATRTSKLCEACSAIFSSEATGAADVDDGDDLDFDHHGSLADFRKAVAEKCPMCRRFFERLSKVVGGLDRVEEHIDPSEHATTVTLTPYSRSLVIQVELNLLKSPRHCVGVMMDLYPRESEPSTL